MTPDPTEVLRQVFGYDAFRGPQAAIVAHVVGGGSALVLMPTGGGKSLCYQIPALCRQGTAVVVSPLIALMQDQVAALRQAGVRAAALHSGEDREALASTWRELREGRLDLLYVSPERLLGGDLIERLAGLPLALFAIDEAHCVSQWGHDFRPEYLHLALLAERFPAVPRIALTATADPRTRSEIVSRLKLEQAGVFLASFDRPNIRYLVQDKQDARRQLLAFLARQRGHAGIVYARSRRRVEQFAAVLAAEGHDAIPYHAGLSPGERAAALERFRHDSGVIVVATIAFGMGIDKPDVRFVAHVDLPRSLEAYYQETGRAGRDGLPAVAWMVHGGGDVPKLRRFIDDSGADSLQKRIEHGRLDALIGYAEASSCRRRILLHYLGDPMAADCGNCDICLEPNPGMDVTEAARKALSAVYRTGARFGAAHLVDVLLGSGSERIRSLGHDRLGVHGIGRELDRGQWRALFRQLIARGYLLAAPDGHGGLCFGPEERVRPLLRGQARLEVRLPPAARERRRGGGDGVAVPGATPGTTATGGADPELLATLKLWRLEQARQQRLPPYLVFHDRSLIAIAERRPTSLEELSEVPGIGQAKLSRYGGAVLDLVQRHGAAT
ncbi:MAG: ATP-dependent DNA helicase RecQ [Cyanobium sp. CACIAM 14]|nr:MAG: ATP-dependent DNA helicase RecQ [Cyanobium sp. CACIAM 14]